MKHLIVYADPNPNSFCHAIVETLKDALEKAGREVTVHDLYEEKFDPVLSQADLLAVSKNDYMADVKEEQQLIQDASVVSFVFPIWWLGPPAILKGYFDRVFAEDFAYANGPEGLVKGFTGKKTVIINTMGARKDVYEQSGMIKAMKKTIDVGIMEYTGWDVVEHLFFGEISTVNDAVRKEYLADVKQLGERLVNSSQQKEKEAW